ncbi:MAG TPA: HEAT repeat domain-containing protein, partial [Roseimicrobium sp.]|nr:HEAT repeat domain-containing protein [Roseimicrobium sp.]
RWWTVIALRQNEDDGATTALGTAVLDEHPLVSGEAVLALVARGAPGSNDAMVRLLTGAPDDYGQYLSRIAIYSGDRKKIQPLLQKAMQQRGGEFRPLQRAIRALDQMYD